MTQHVKCDYLVTPENFLHQIWYDCLAGSCSLMCWFCLKLLHVYEIGITPNFKFGFCNYTSLYLLRDVTFRTVIVKFAEKVETELRKVDNWTYSCAWTVTESATKLKGGNCRPKQREQLRTLNAPQTMACETACTRQQFVTFSAYCYQFWASLPIVHINTFTYQFYGVQHPVFFPVNLKIILRNVTSWKNNDVQLQNSNLKFGVMSISFM